MISSGVMGRGFGIGDLAKGAGASRVGSGRRFTGAVDADASTALRCSTGRAAAQLASLTSFAPLRQARRVRSGSARGALPVRPALLGAPEARRPAPTRLAPTPFAAPVVAGGMTPDEIGELELNTFRTRASCAVVAASHLAASPLSPVHQLAHAAVVLAWRVGAVGFGAGDSRGGEEHRGGIGARSALPPSDSPHLSERSERSERSELCGAIPTRAPQRSRRNAPATPPEPVPSPTAPARHARRSIVAIRESMENSR